MNLGFGEIALIVFVALLLLALKTAGIRKSCWKNVKRV